ncbi:MAG: hypothetical protein H6603_00375 [Flavobacteriales bacterium]|nr:hypothetical protein [Flavobacteriales bacterium]MCB9203403.1 hypothetical protein [Flavobacteriales bacterium]
MKNTVLLFAIAILSISQSFAQDRLFFLNGDETDVKITEVSSSEVKYKRMDNLEGPTFSTLKTELFMIKYANGDKEMMATQTAEPVTQPAVVETEQEYKTEDATGSSDLGSAVLVTDEPATPAVSNVDKWGRDEAENRRLHKKKIKQGAVLMGVGAITVGVGGTLLYLGNVNNSTSTVGPNGAPNRSVPTVAIGVVGIVGGSAMLVSGAILLGVSSKYKKRADQLASGTASLSPSILNTTSYNGSIIRTQAAYGITFSYNF